MKLLGFFLIITIFAVFAVGTSNSSSTNEMPSPTVVVPKTVLILNESAGKKEDIQKAREFLESLPPACGRTTASVEDDGTVRIRIRCENSTKSMNGMVKIKDGIITDLQ